MGTPDYLAPEQIRGEGVSGAADEYALACVLFECLTGAPPFHRATEAETLWAHMQDPVPSVPGRPELDPVLRKALAEEPGLRAMADAIRLVLEVHDYRAVRYSIGYRSCDDSIAQTGLFDRRTCAANANAYARARTPVAVIGTFNSA